MPNSIITKVSSICELPVEELEARWKKAEEITEKQYGLKNKFNYQLITSIFKHSLGKECNSKMGWNTNWKQKLISESINKLIYRIKI
jgi:hypothetical protein